MIWVVVIFAEFVVLFSVLVELFLPVVVSLPATALLTFLFQVAKVLF